MKVSVVLLLMLICFLATAQNSFLRGFSNNYQSSTYSATETQGSGYLLAGVTKPNYFAKEDIVLTKVDSMGNLQWVKAYGDTFDNICYKVIPMRSGGFVLTGYTNNSLGLADMLLMKVDDTGKLLWIKAYGNAIRGEQARDVKQAANGDLLIVGTASGYQDTAKTYFVRTDSAGNILYSNRFLVGRESYGGSILELPDNSIIIGGDVYGADTIYYSASDAYLLKLDPSGAPLWSRAYNLGWEDNLRAVVEAYGGGFTILTYSYDDSYWYSGLIRTTAIGDTIWTKLYNSQFFLPPAGIMQTQDSGYVIAAATTLFFKTDENGNAQSAKWLGKNGVLMQTIERGDGSLALFGTLYNSQLSMFAGATDVNYNTCNDSTVSIVYPPEYYLQMAPSIVMYGPMDSMQTTTISSLPFAFQQTNLCDPTGINAPTASPVFEIYPNPASDRLNISFPDCNGYDLDLSIVDVNGRLVYKEHKAASSFVTITQIDVSHWSKGIYFIKLKSDRFGEMRKIVVN